MRKANVKLKNKSGEDVIYSGVTTVSLEDDAGSTKTFSLGEMKTATINLDFSEGDQVAEASDTELYDKVIVLKPDTFKAENIAQGIVIAGIEGTFEGAKEVPTLNVPTISRSSDTITISNPSTNGNFNKSFNIYSNDELFFNTTGTTFSLIGRFEEENDYVIRATCVNPLMNESSKSSSISFAVYSIIKELADHITTTDTTTKRSNGLSYSFTVVAAFGFWLNEMIDVYEKANGTEDYTMTDDYTYSMYTGVISVSSLKSNLKFIVGCTNYAFLERPTISFDDESYIMTIDYTKHSQKIVVYVDDNLMDSFTNETEDTSTLTADTYSMDDYFMLHLANTEYDGKKAPYICHHIYLDDVIMDEIKEEVIWR